MAIGCPVCGVGDWRFCSNCGFRSRRFNDGIFEAVDIAPSTDYPDDGHSRLFALEDSSFWFAHRNAVIAACVRHYPWQGACLDVGGGNGFQTRMLAALGPRAVLIEPSITGCRNAAKRAIRAVVRGKLETLGLKDETVGAIALFDVAEHIEDPSALIDECVRVLRPGGLMYLTVPALPWLWSEEDVYAKHKRRYSATMLRALIVRHRLEVEYLSYFFIPLVPAVFLSRVVPSWLGLRSSRDSVNDEHAARGIAGALMRRLLMCELGRVVNAERLVIGSSLICVARKT